MIFNELHFLPDWIAVAGAMSSMQGYATSKSDDEHPETQAQEPANEMVHLRANVL